MYLPTPWFMRNATQDHREKMADIVKDIMNVRTTKKREEDKVMRQMRHHIHTNLHPQFKVADALVEMSMAKPSQIHKKYYRWVMRDINGYMCQKFCNRERFRMYNTESAMGTEEFDMYYKTKAELEEEKVDPIMQLFATSFPYDGSAPVYQPEMHYWAGQIYTYCYKCGEYKEKCLAVAATQFIRQHQYKGVTRRWVPLRCIDYSNNYYLCNGCRMLIYAAFYKRVALIDGQWVDSPILIQNKHILKHEMSWSRWAQEKVKGEVSILVDDRNRKRKQVNKRKQEKRAQKSLPIKKRKIEK
jgi:hypothetical protein